MYPLYWTNQLKRVHITFVKTAAFFLLMLYLNSWRTFLFATYA